MAPRIIPQISFSLRENTIQLVVRYKGERYSRQTTGLTCKPGDWDKKKNLPKVSSAAYSPLKKEIDRVGHLVMEYFDACHDRNYTPTKEEAAQAQGNRT